MTISDSLIGRRALVTGGSKGQGAAVVARLRDAGALVMTAARTKPDNGPHPDLFITADVGTAAGAQTVLDAVRTRLGVLDILVHVVGGSHAPPGGFAALSDEHWHEELNLNLLAAVRLDRGLLPAMIAARSGAVVHISSIQRRMPLFEATLGYAAAKAALTTYSRGLANEVGPAGVRVNTIAPGFVQTAGADRLIDRISHDTGINRDAHPPLLRPCVPSRYAVVLRPVHRSRHRRGRRRPAEGIDAIRAWRTEAPRVAYTVHDIVTADPGHDAPVDIAGDFPGSPVRLTFHFEFTANDHIAALDIHP